MFDNLFNKDESNEELEYTKKLKQIEEAQKARDKALQDLNKRMSTFVDSDVYKDIKLMIKDLKQLSASEARQFKDSSFLHGIDYLTRLEDMIDEYGQ